MTIMSRSDLLVESVNQKLIPDWSCMSHGAFDILTQTTDPVTTVRHLIKAPFPSIMRVRLAFSKNKKTGPHT